MTQKASQAALSHWRIIQAMGIRCKKEREGESGMDREGEDTKKRLLFINA